MYNLGMYDEHYYYDFNKYVFNNMLFGVLICLHFTFYLSYLACIFTCYLSLT